MHQRLFHGWTTLGLITFALGVLGATPPSRAAISTFQILIDADNNPATGCTVPTVNGPFYGVEKILVTTVATSTGPPAAQVTNLQEETCTAPPSTFSAPVPVILPAGVTLPWSVGLDNGVGGAGVDVIETFIPIVELGSPTPQFVHVAVLACDASGTTCKDALTTTQPLPAIQSSIIIQLAAIAQIPTLGEWGLLLLALGLGGAAFVALRRRQRFAFVLLCLLGAGATALFAATVVLDGNTNDWAPGTQVATDASGDPAPDLRALFAQHDAANLYFRIDSTLQFSSPQTITFTSTAPAGATVGGPTYTVSATATSGLPVSFTIDASAAAVCSIAGSTVSFTAPGSCVIDANQAGNANWDPAPQPQQSFAVGKGNQTITFTSTAPAGATVGGPTYTVSATATSGLPVTFTIDASASAVCSIAGSTVSFTGAGTCVINANQAGNTNYNAAPQVQQSFGVGKGNQTVTFTSTAPAGASVGGPTYTATATASSGLGVALSIDAAAASVCSISGSTISFIGVGTCVIDANQPGDTNWNAAPQAQQSFAVGKGSQTITFTSKAPAGAKVGGPTYTVTATASSGLAVTFTIDAAATAVCSISGSTVSFIGVGTCVIDANQAGNANYSAALQVQQSFAVAKGDQTITFTSTAPAGAKVGGPTYTVTATASSGLAVTFTIDASAASFCSISGSTVSFIGVGTCVIDANQPGNANYNAAPQVQQSFPVAKGDQTITFTSTAPEGAKVGGPTYTVSATASSGLPVTFAIDAAATAICTISGSTVSFIGAGSCVIDANQAGSANSNAAPQVQQSFAVAKGDQTITYTSTAPAGAKVGGPTYTVTATASSGLPVTFTIDASAAAACSISGSTVSFIGVGTCVIDANQAGNANYNAAPQVQQSFPVAKGDQTISYSSTAPAGAKVGGPTYTVTATTSSGLPVAFTIDASASGICSISSSTVSFIGVGTCVIDANQAGNANYNPAPQVQQPFPVAKGDQTINFTSTAPASAKVGGPTYTATANATSGLAVTLTIDASAASVCSISGSTVSFIGAGSCVIDANQAGNGNYNAAPQVQQAFPVAKGDQTISYTSSAPATAKVGGPTYTVAATATSGLAVTFTIDVSAVSVCSISGSTVSFIGAGACVIDANQTGNGNYNAAPQKQQSFAVAKGDQTISFTSTPPAPATPGGPTYTVTATATSGLAVAFTIDASTASICTISGSTVTFTSPYTGGSPSSPCLIDANQAGNGNYNAAPQVQQSVTVDAPPKISSVTPANGALNVALNATVTMNFSEQVNVTASAFKLECPTGTPIAFTVTPASPASSFVLHPTSNLPGGAVCTVTAVASQVSDTDASQHMAADFSSSFTVDSPPTVTSTVPTNGATGVTPSSTVTVNFSKSVTVTGSAFTLECPTGTAVTFTASPASPAASYVLHPSPSLPAGVVCTTTVVASQVTDAVGTAMASNFVFSFSVPPVATNDTYPHNVVGHVSVNSSLISYSVTTNDVSAAPFTITAFDATTVHGGSVTMTTSGPGMGQLTYNPPVGYTGPDSFTYTISNAAGSGTGTVSLTVSGLIWFINNSAGAGDGRLSSPLNTLAAFQAVNDGAAGHGAANHNIFLYESGTDYTGPVTLLSGQKLIGQDATATLATITGLTPGASSAALPTMNSSNPTITRITSAGNTVTLGSNNEVQGLTLGNSAGLALTGTSFGTLKVRDVGINTTGSALSLTTGTLDAILKTVSSSSGTNGIKLSGTTGSIEVTGDGASDPASTTRGRTTAKSGGGTLALGSGGTITGATSAGVLLSNAAGVTLRNMTIQNNGSGINTGGDGITASGGTSGLTLDNVKITGHAGNFGLHGTTVSGLTLQHTEISANATTAGTEGPNVWNVRFDDLTGTSSFLNSLFFNSRENIVGLNEGTISANAALSLTITNSQFTDTTNVSPGNDCLLVVSTGNANVSVSLTRSNFLRCFARGFQYQVNGSAGGGAVTVANNTFETLASTDIDIDHQGLGKTLTFDINHNVLRQTTVGTGTAINIFLGGLSNAATLLQGKVSFNTIGNAGLSKSGSNFGKGIDLFASGAGTLTAKVDNNITRSIWGDSAFRAISSTHVAPGRLNVTVTANDFQVEQSGNAGDGTTLVVGGAGNADTAGMCAHLFGNTAAVGDPVAGGVGINLLGGSTSATAVIDLEGYGGAANNTAQINAFLNTTATTVNPPATSFSFSSIKAAASPCPTPP